MACLPFLDDLAETLAALGDISVGSSSGVLLLDDLENNGKTSGISELLDDLEMSGMLLPPLDALENSA